MTNVESEVASYFAKYGPATAKLGRALRAKLRARLPGLNELVYVYENQRSLVIAYSPSERGFEGLCSLAVRPNKVSLYFGRGAELSKADPQKLLKGSGTTVRQVALESVADLDRPELEALMVAALELARVRLDPSAKRAVIIRAQEQKKRAARAAKAARPTAARKKTKPAR